MSKDSKDSKDTTTTKKLKDNPALTHHALGDWLVRHYQLGSYGIPDATSKTTTHPSFRVVRGDIVWMQFDFPIGVELFKTRPVLVLRDSETSDYGIYGAPTSTQEPPSNEHIRRHYVRIPESAIIDRNPAKYLEESWINVIKVGCFSKIRVQLPALVIQEPGVPWREDWWQNASFGSIARDHARVRGGRLDPAALPTIFAEIAKKIGKEIWNPVPHRP